VQFYGRCGLSGIKLSINSLGDSASKEQYRRALVAYLTPKAASLSEDSQRRLIENPLRILDSKDPRDIQACQGAPPSLGCLSEKSRKHFDRVNELLRAVPGLEPHIDLTLVRGFDYYTETLWEVIAPGLGAQNAIGGGGRYDNLVEMLGGRPTPGVGFGSGLERLLLALEAQGVALPNHRKPLVWLVSLGDAAKDANWQLLRELRSNGIAADLDPTGRSAKSQFKIADREKAMWVITVGESELAANIVELKDMKTGVQTKVSRAEIVQHLQR
jgi:histidyl-tRNA synthetase